jgi:hypothetical protein
VSQPLDRAKPLWGLRCRPQHHPPQRRANGNGRRGTRLESATRAQQQPAGGGGSGPGRPPYR